MGDDTYDCIVIGGGIGGAAAALRAAQYHLKTAWVRGTRKTAKASRGKYVMNIDNMIGVHPGVMLGQVNKVLKGDKFAAARERLAEETFHIGSQEIIDNALERIETTFGEWVTIIEQKATAVERSGDLFRIGLAAIPVPDAPEAIAGRNVVLSTGVMDRLPEVKKITKRGKEVDDIKWVFPFSNLERLLYCIRCEGHLVDRGAAVIVGHSETACQVGLMLHERYGVPLTMVTNGEELQAAEATRRLMTSYGIGVESARIVGFDDHAEGEELTKKQPGSDLHAILLEDGTRVTARYGLVSLGLYRVYNDLARQAGAELEAGEKPDDQKRVLVADYSSETDVRGLFCVGDMATRKDGGPSMMQIYTAQEYAVRAVDTIDRRLRKARRAAVLEG